MNYVEAIQEAVQLRKRIKPVDSQNYYYKYYNINNDGKSFAKYIIKNNSFCGLVHLVEPYLIDAKWEILEDHPEDFVSFHLKAALDKNSETLTDIIGVEPSYYKFSNKWKELDIKPFYAWTSKYIYFIYDYDGGWHREVKSLPRDPGPCEPKIIGE